MSHAFGSMFDEKTNPRSFFVLMYIICLVTPFLILYWLVPLFSSLTIGNDYVSFPIEHQMALMFSLENGSFPFYVPGFAMGQSAAALTLGQLYHPLSYLSSMLPGYWEGDALIINTQWRLLSIGVAHLVLLHALRALGLNCIMAFVLSFITVYNLRMLDMFRYGSSLENFTAFIMLCSFIVLSFTESKKCYFSGIAVSSYLLTVGGHPQIAYIGFIGAAILTLMTPMFVSTIEPKYTKEKERLFLYWALVFVATSIGVLFAAPYIFGFYFDFLPHNAIRTNNTYEWAIAYQDSWGGLFKSFYSPLSSNVHGAFGSSALIIVALLFPFAAFIFKSYKANAWLVFIIALFIFLVSAGDATAVHRIVWEYLPMASNFRVPGRFAMMILFPLLFVIIWIVTRGKVGENHKQVIPVLKSNIAFIFFVAAGLFVMLNISFDHMFPEATWPRPDDINNVSKVNFDHGLYLGLAALLLAGAYFELLARRFDRWANIFGLILVCVVMIEVTNTLRYGTWVVDSKQHKTKDEFLAHMQDKFSVPAVPGNGMSMALMDEQMNRSMFETKIARYYRNVTAIAAEDELNLYLVTNRRPNEAVVLADPKFSIKSTEKEDRKEEGDSIDLVEYRYNQYTFDVNTGHTGLFSTNLPFRENWLAFVDGKPVPIHMANGYEVSVFLSEGMHRVVLQYDSKETWAGIVLACIVFVMVMIFFIWNSSARNIKVALVAMCALPYLFYSWWYESLYGGAGIAISYHWDSSDFPAVNNLAYGKHAVATSNNNAQMPYYHYAGIAVDGNTKDGIFATSRMHMPMWKLDLGSNYSPTMVNLHGILPQSLPVTLWVSTDDKAYDSVSRVVTESPVYEINFAKQKEFRYLVVRSERNGVLGFKEVEVLVDDMDVN